MADYSVDLLIQAGAKVGLELDYSANRCKSWSIGWRGRVLFDTDDYHQARAFIVGWEACILKVAFN